METAQIKVEVQPTYRVEQTIISPEGGTPTDDELTYCGKLTLYWADK